MLKIRNFNEDDRQVLRRIFLSSRKETFSWLDTSAYTHEDFDEATAKESIMIAEEEGVVMGFIAFCGKVVLSITYILTLITLKREREKLC
jgi:hypothetical protein